MQDSPSRSPASRVFPHVLKSPRRIRRPSTRHFDPWCTNSLVHVLLSCLWVFMMFLHCLRFRACGGRFVLHPKIQTTPWRAGDVERATERLEAGTGAMFVGAQKKLPKKERGRKEKGEDYIISHLIKSSH